MEPARNFMLPVALRLVGFLEDPEVADLIAEQYRQKGIRFGEMVEKG